MGIFSFGKKDDASNRRGAPTSSKRGSSGVDRSERVERRTRRAERAGDADAMLLDPTLPEKQRARRRLVGAIALVVAAVVILPMVLDSHPKPVTDDISIDIPSRPVSRARTQDPQDTQAGVAPDNPAVPAETGTGATAGVQGASSLSASSARATAAAGSSGHTATQDAATAQAQAQTQASGKWQQAPVTAANTAPTAAKPAAKSGQTAAAASTPARSSAAETAANARQSTTQNTTQSATAAQTDSGTPAAPPGSRFAVQLGSFPDDASARNWAARLKAAGVPAYTERRKQADGSVHTLLRAGPFADRAAASAAIAKVREVGLTSGANNGSAQ
ncbi:SPOR domain-containing protein [Paraburkholderia solisilvae]|uniref:Cell division protein DedD n=1 Tax=Paraburkholderia solisilvae TaxID=624376 RepID=A0A6J5DT29_9BURK|nr:SPOR domain-containing protein [Paraburkholderia solisilvae]CAB3757399.1 Cell division protein DedD [Paraburkholderia solisilvae]